MQRVISVPRARRCRLQGRLERHLSQWTSAQRTLAVVSSRGFMRVRMRGRAGQEHAQLIQRPTHVPRRPSPQPLSRSAAQPLSRVRAVVPASRHQPRSAFAAPLRAPCPAPIAGSAPPRPPLARREAPPGPGAAGEGHLPGGSGAHPCTQRGPHPRQCPPSSSSVVSFSKAVFGFSTHSPDWLDEGDSSSGA